MSLYQFIACDNELPELFSNKKRLYFTDVLWPDFNKEELEKAIADVSIINRRYGNGIE